MVYLYHTIQFKPFEVHSSFIILKGEGATEIVNVWNDYMYYEMKDECTFLINFNFIGIYREIRLCISCGVLTSVVMCMYIH